MTAKEELSQYIHLQKYVDEKLEEYKRFEDKATNTTSTLSDMARSSSEIKDRMAECVAKMADLSREYCKVWEDAERMKLQIETKIGQIKQPSGLLLHYRYIRNMKLEEIACKMGYTYDTIRHMHGEALQEYENLTH